MQTPVPRPKLRVMSTPDRNWSPAHFTTPPHAPSSTVRYLDIRVAVPSDLSEDQLEKYLAKHGSMAPEASPLTVASPLYDASPSGHGRDSPFGFIPIESSPFNSTHGSRSPFSPSNVSMKSSGTATTAESSLAIALRAASPGLVASLAPPLYESPRHKTSSSPSPASISTNGRKSPFVDTDDTVKKTRLKTELCMHYANGRPCPFGSNCTYAHGEEELQMTKLVDLHKAGLIDMETYRTRPCWTWVATGSWYVHPCHGQRTVVLFLLIPLETHTRCRYSPFGKRCCSIHDPRVQGEYDSWLTHTETQGNNSATDINVEALYQKLQHEIHCGTPFGEQFLPEVDSWNELYKRVSNIYYKDKNVPRNNKSWIDNTRRTPLLPAVTKLQIAIVMREDPDFSYKYCPQHIIHGELCMVLQKRAFRMSGKKSNRILTPILHHQYNPNSHTDIMVHELAFGPDCDSTARPVSLWFNLDPNEIVKCTETQAKRFRWKRGLKTAKETRRSPFDHLDNFQMIRPREKDAFHLTTDILKNRLQMLQAEQIVNLKERSEMLSFVRREKDHLQKRFDALLRHWLEWGWPVSKGRIKADRNTPVPRIDGNYEPPMDGPAQGGENVEWAACELAEDSEKIFMGQQSQRVWKSFTQCEVRFRSQENTMLLYCRPNLTCFCIPSTSGHFQWFPSFFSEDHKCLSTLANLLSSLLWRGNRRGS